MNDKDSIYLATVVAGLWLQDNIDSLVTDRLFDALKDVSEGDALLIINAIREAVM